MKLLVHLFTDESKRRLSNHPFMYMIVSVTTATTVTPLLIRSEKPADRMGRSRNRSTLLFVARTLLSIS